MLYFEAKALPGKRQGQRLPETNRCLEAEGDMSEQQPDEQQLEEQQLYELKIADYPIDPEQAQALITRLTEELEKGERPMFQAGSESDVPMRALLVTDKGEDVFEIYCYAEAEPMGRVRIDMDLRQGQASVFVILTEEERDQLSEAAESPQAPD